MIWTFLIFGRISDKILSSQRQVTEMKQVWPLPEGMDIPGREIYRCYRIVLDKKVQQSSQPGSISRYQSGKVVRILTVKLSYAILLDCSY